MKKIYYLTLFLIAAVQFTNAQSISNYNFGITTSSLEDMASAVTLLGRHADSKVTGKEPFFTFYFNNQFYNSFSVSEDGIVVLGTATYSPREYDNYLMQTYWGPSGAGTTYGDGPVFPLILPWGEDLTTTTNGGIAYKIVGAAPNRKLVIEYKVKSIEGMSAQYFYDVIENKDLSKYDYPFDKTFQVWLFETSNKIAFVYGDIKDLTMYNQANIGIAASATNFLSVNCTEKKVSTTTVSSNNYDVNNPASLPNNGTAYVFSTTFDVSLPAVVAPVSSFSAAVSISPQFCVAGQQPYTIYLGYEQQSVTLNTTISGANATTGNYTYSWSSVPVGFSSTAASPVVSPKITTTYNVTITDGNGRSTEQAVTVYVIDPRLGDKFIVCKNGKKELVISKEAVAAQLASGAILGDCPASSASGAIGTATSINAIVAEEALAKVSAVYPSPSSGLFTVQLPKGLQQKTIIVVDVAGRQVAKKIAGEEQQNVQFNLANYSPGVYLVKVFSGKDVQTSKIILQ